MAVFKQVKLANGTVIDVRDDVASHYIGTTTTALTEGTTSATVSINSNNVTAVKHDWVRTKATNGKIEAFIYLGATDGGWVKFVEGIDVKDVQVSGTSVVDATTRVANISAIPADIIGTTGHMQLSSGVTSATPTADGEVANKKYVDDSVKDIASAMVFKGGITATTSGTPATTTLTLADDTLGNINEGYTFKFTANETGGTTFKVGDILIANEDITHTAPEQPTDPEEPRVPNTIVYDSSKWTLVPSGDDVDVTAIKAGTGLSAKTGTDGTGSVINDGIITSSGTIDLKLESTTAFGSSDNTYDLGLKSNGNLGVKIDVIDATTDITGATSSDTTGETVAPYVLKQVFDTKQDTVTAGNELSFGTGAAAATLNHDEKLGTTKKTTTAVVQKVAVNEYGHVTDAGAADTASVVGAVASAAPGSSAPTGTALTVVGYDSSNEILEIYQVGVSTQANVVTQATS